MLTEYELEIENRCKNRIFIADKDIAYLFSTIQQLRRERDKLRFENDHLHGVLKWYTDKDNYVPSEDGYMKLQTTPIYKSKGGKNESN